MQEQEAPQQEPEQQQPALPLVDYVAVIGVADLPRRPGSVASAEEAAEDGPRGRAVPTAVVFDRWPLEEREGFPLPQELATFCLPQQRSFGEDEDDMGGWGGGDDGEEASVSSDGGGSPRGGSGGAGLSSLATGMRTLEELNNALYYSFALTDAYGQRSFGVAVQHYVPLLGGSGSGGGAASASAGAGGAEEVDVYSAAEAAALGHRQKEHEQQLQQQQQQLLQQQQQQQQRKGRRGRKIPGLRRSAVAPGSYVMCKPQVICLISRVPFYSLFHAILRDIYQHTALVPIEALQSRAWNSPSRGLGSGDSAGSIDGSGNNNNNNNGDKGEPGSMKRSLMGAMSKMSRIWNKAVTAPSSPATSSPLASSPSTPDGAERESASAPDTPAEPASRSDTPTTQAAPEMLATPITEQSPPTPPPATETGATSASSISAATTASDSTSPSEQSSSNSKPNPPPSAVPTLPALGSRMPGQLGLGLRAPIEQVIANLTDEAIAPPLGGVIRLNPCGSRIAYFHGTGSSNGLPHLDDACLRCLLSRLSTANIVRILSALALEQRVLLWSEDISALTPCCEALIALLFPFCWQHIYIPCLPLALVDCLEAPVPFLIGVPRSFLTTRGNEVTSTDTLRVDLDANTVQTPSTGFGGIRGSGILELPLEVLETLLHQLDKEICVPDPNATWRHPETGREEIQRMDSTGSGSRDGMDTMSDSGNAVGDDLSSGGGGGTSRFSELMNSLLNRQTKTVRRAHAFTRSTSLQNQYLEYDVVFNEGPLGLELQSTHALMVETDSRMGADQDGAEASGNNSSSHSAGGKKYEFIDSSAAVRGFRTVNGAPGPAERSGLVRAGSYVVAINGDSTLHLTFAETMAKLKAAPRPVVLRFQNGKFTGRQISTSLYSEAGPGISTPSSSMPTTSGPNPTDADGDVDMASNGEAGMAKDKNTEPETEDGAVVDVAAEEAKRRQIVQRHHDKRGSISFQSPKGMSDNVAELVNGEAWIDKARASFLEMWCVLFAAFRAFVKPETPESRQAALEAAHGTPGSTASGPVRGDEPQHEFDREAFLAACPSPWRPFLEGVINTHMFYCLVHETCECMLGHAHNPEIDLFFRCMNMRGYEEIERHIARRHFHPIMTISLAEPVPPPEESPAEDAASPMPMPTPTPQSQQPLGQPRRQETFRYFGFPRLDSTKFRPPRPDAMSTKVNPMLELAAKVAEVRAHARSVSSPPPLGAVAAEGGSTAASSTASPEAASAVAAADEQDDTSVPLTNVSTMSVTTAVDDEEIAAVSLLAAVTHHATAAPAAGGGGAGGAAQEARSRTVSADEPTPATSASVATPVSDGPRSRTASATVADSEAGGALLPPAPPVPSIASPLSPTTSAPELARRFSSRVPRKSLSGVRTRELQQVAVEESLRGSSGRNSTALSAILEGDGSEVEQLKSAHELQYEDTDSEPEEGNGETGDEETQGGHEQRQEVDATENIVSGVATSTSKGPANTPSRTAPVDSPWSAVSTRSEGALASSRRGPSSTDIASGAAQEFLSPQTAGHKPRKRSSKTDGRSAAEAKKFWTDVGRRVSVVDRDWARHQQRLLQQLQVAEDRKLQEDAAEAAGGEDAPSDTSSDRTRSPVVSTAAAARARSPPRRHTGGLSGSTVAAVAGSKSPSPTAVVRTQSPSPSDRRQRSPHTANAVVQQSNAEAGGAVDGPSPQLANDLAGAGLPSAVARSRSRSTGATEGAEPLAQLKQKLAEDVQRNLDDANAEIEENDNNADEDR